jgi:cell division septation protein DedD
MEEYEDEPRSIFSALWFRALLAVLVLGVLAAVAVPYVLDVATTPALKPAASSNPAVETPPAPVTAPPSTSTAAPAPPSGVTTAPGPPPSSVPPEPARAPSKPDAQPPVVSGRSAAVAKTATPAAKPGTAAAKPVAKAVETPKPAQKAAAVTKPSPTKTVSGTADGGPYWVQVGAYQDAETARRLVARLREQGLRVEESATRTSASRPATPPTGGPSPGDRYDVVVSGASAADVDTKLAPRGMTAETTANGVVARPSLPLRDAVALSRDLADAGLSVQVRRVGGPAPVAAPAGEATLHRVRVGGFPDRATAMAALKQLEDRGFKPFIAREPE